MEKRFRGHYFLPAERGALSAEPPFFLSLSIASETGKESVNGTLLASLRLIDIVVIRRQQDVWLRAADRSPAAESDIVWELQVFVILPKDKGDSLRETPLPDEKKARSFAVGGVSL